MYGNMAVKMAVVKNLVAVKGLQVAVNFGEGGSEGLPRSGNPASMPLSASVPVADPSSIVISPSECPKIRSG